MFHTCPSCHQFIPLDVTNVIDEQIITCPHCSHHYKIYLDPKAKQILESSNRQMLEYMMAYPHPHQDVAEEFPSGIMNTFE